MGKVSKWQEKRGKNGKNRCLRSAPAGTCDSCVFFLSDEEAMAARSILIEDEYTRYVIGKRTEGCPYYRDGDEYRTVRKQI